MKYFLYTFLLINSISAYSQVSDEIYETIIKKSPKEFVHESECSFIIHVEEDNPIQYQRIYKKGYTFCFYGQEELFSHLINYFIRVKEEGSKVQIEWIHDPGGGSLVNSTVNKRKRIKMDYR